MKLLRHATVRGHMILNARQISVALLKQGADQRMKKRILPVERFQGNFLPRHRGEGFKEGSIQR